MSTRNPIRKLAGGRVGYGSFIRADENIEMARVNPANGVSHTTRGTFVRPQKLKGGSFDFTQLSFGLTYTGTTATVQKGRVFVDGTTSFWDLDLTTVTLTGDYCWVTLRKVISLGTPSIEAVADSYPANSATTVYRPFARFKKNGTVYVPDAPAWRLYIGGDIALTVPLAYS